MGQYLRTVQDVVYHMFLQVSAWPYFPRGVKTLRILHNKSNKEAEFMNNYVEVSWHKLESSET